MTDFRGGESDLRSVESDFGGSDDRLPWHWNRVPEVDPRVGNRRRRGLAS